MKKVCLVMVMVFLYPRLLVAQDFDIDSLLGETWYGLYLNGQKAGFSCNTADKDDEGNIVVSEEAQFQMNMAGVKQDMHIFSKRVYAAEGPLLRIESTIKDPARVTRFDATVIGDRMRLVSTVADRVDEKELPRPKESLADALKHARWMQDGPQVGDSLSFNVFEPLYEREVDGISHIIGVEDRVLDGAPTKVYKVKTRIEAMGIDSIAYVAEDGTTLEDVVAGFITMRVEPEETAKDVTYSNDVIVSNAAIVDTPVGNPRGRASLRLTIEGPLTEDHLYNDERQFLEKAGDRFNFVGTQIFLDEFKAARLPITDEHVLKWIEPSTFVQSDDSRLVEKAREIVGDETDSLAVSKLLCRWVNENMHTTFSARLTNALEVFDSMEGDCTEHSILFIGLVRAAGLPAREVAGLVYVVGSPPGFYFHQWAKVWVGKWIDVDPTFDQPLADVTHIKLAEGDLFSQARLIPVIGKLGITVVPEPGGDVVNTERKSLPGETADTQAAPAIPPTQ